MCFVDFKRAFPSVRREILLKKYADDGMYDSLIRVIWAIYKGATATIRGKHGYGRLFEILLGTREGGSEGPLLFVLFIRDLIEHLEKISLSGSPVFLARTLVRALLLADDLALVASCAEDLQALLDGWCSYCDENHLQTNVMKTEVVVFTFQGDSCPIYKGMLRELVYKSSGELSKDIELFTAFVYKNKKIKSHRMCTSVFSCTGCPQPMLRGLRVKLRVGKLSDR